MGLVGRWRAVISDFCKLPWAPGKAHSRAGGVVGMDWARLVGEDARCARTSATGADCVSPLNLFANPPHPRIHFCSCS